MTTAQQIVERAWAQYNASRLAHRDHTEAFYVTYEEKETLLREHPATAAEWSVDRDNLYIFGMRVTVLPMRRYLVWVVAVGDDGRERWGVQRLVFENEVRFLPIIIDYLDASLSLIAVRSSKANWYWASREWKA